MRRAGLAIFAAAAALVGAVPAWSGDDGKRPPVAELSVSPESVDVGAPVALDASASRDPDGSVLSFAWDLDGDGAFERQSGAEARVAHAFEAAGSHSVGVRVLDESGASADAQRTLVVAAPPEPEPEPAPAPEPEPAAEPEPEPAANPKPEPAPKQRKQRVTPAAQQEEAEPVQAAASQTVSIKDFSFAPRSVTVSVGDSVTFRNTGDEAHTATARDGSFDTGNLTSGQSGSVTFRKAGSFSYFCKPHAFMTGTVTVSGGGSGGGGGGGDTQGVTGPGDAGGGAGSSGGGGAGDGDDLPSTGLALAPFLVIGLTMLGSGVALRRRCATSAA